MIRQAHEMEMLTCPYVFDVEQTVKMTEAGADVLVTHMNTTVKGSIGVSSDLAPTLEESAKRIQEMHDVAREIREDVIVLCHGGPIAEPEDAQYIFEHTEGVAGFFGASSVERLATERAIEAQAKAFKTLKI